MIPFLVCYYGEQGVLSTRHSEIQGKIAAELAPHKLQPEEMPEVRTIDGYEGVDNEIVIMSLVRSDAKKKLCFLALPMLRTACAWHSPRPNIMWAVEELLQVSAILSRFFRAGLGHVEQF